MDDFRLGKDQLWITLDAWDDYVTRRVHLVACGGTALSIQDIKESTKDVDFLVPDINEFKRLIDTIKKLGYSNVTQFGWSRGDQLIFDLFPGKRVYTTELLSSPGLKGNHIPIRSFKRIAVSALNDYDLIISKIFRCSQVDIDDCLALIGRRRKSFDEARLRKRFIETAQYDLNPERMISNLENLLRRVQHDR